MDNFTNEFVDKFQTFENLLKAVTESNDRTRFIDALKKASDLNVYINENFSLIEDLYALRNVFSHRERGKYIATIDEFVLKELDKLINVLKNPPTVISKFRTIVYQANTHDFIITIMNEMRNKTYTHVPVWNKDQFLGVFSYTSFFEWLAERQSKENTEVTFSKKFMDDIDIKYLNPQCVNFEFIPESANLYEIPPMFAKATLQQKRLDCLLITANGKKGEKITGIITPWDIGLIK